MTTIHVQRQASIEEIAREMDRRGEVIERLEAERNLYKGKYGAFLKLMSKTRDKLVHVTDHIEDEGDRVYFGNTNDADDLRAIYDEIEAWVWWDALDKVNDPYADIRKQRARADRAEKALDKVEDLIAEFGDDPKAALECVGEYLGLCRNNTGKDAAK